jgi:hypothetical protein
MICTVHQIILNCNLFNDDRSVTDIVKCRKKACQVKDKLERIWK